MVLLVGGVDEEAQRAATTACDAHRAASVSLQAAHCTTRTLQASSAQLTMRDSGAPQAAHAPITAGRSPNDTEPRPSKT
jgi:hypothetical protein